MRLRNQTETPSLNMEDQQNNPPQGDNNNNNDNEDDSHHSNEIHLLREENRLQKERLKALQRAVEELRNRGANNSSPTSSSHSIDDDEEEERSNNNRSQEKNSVAPHTLELITQNLQQMLKQQEKLAKQVAAPASVDASKSTESKPHKVDMKLTTMNYSGEGGENLKMFLWQNETVFIAKNVPEDLKVVSIIPQLRGKAAKYIQSLGEEIYKYTWKDFKKKMEATFLSKLEKAQLLEKLSSLEQRRDLFTYDTEFLTLTNRLKAELSDTMTLMYYLKGLKPKIQSEVRYKGPSDLKQAMEIAHLYECAMVGSQNFENSKGHNNHQEKKDHHSNRSHSSEKKSHDGSKKRHHSKSSWKSRGSNQDSRKTDTPQKKNQFVGNDPVCNHCGGVGHIRKDCEKWKKEKAKKVNNLEALPLQSEPLN